MTTRKKKSSREKRVLIASVIVAATIVAGSTFAWFTSKDEVTNRLTAKADYGVSITENFTPPEDWTPGQEINKDVSAVNTGNVDAYMRMKLSYALKGKAIDPAGVAIAETVPENAVKIDTSANANEDWRKTYQTGELVVLAGTAVTDGTKINVDGTAQEANDGKADAEFRDGAVLVNSKTYTPQTKGLYIFRRQIENMNNENPNYSFSGYYFDGNDYYKLNTVIDNDGNVTADIVGLQGVTDSVPTDTQIKAVKLAATMNLPELTANNTTAVLNADAKTIKLTYAGADGNTTKDNIIIDIKLADDYADNWSYLKDEVNDSKNLNGWFYYNNIIKAGETSKMLVDSVKLDGAVTSGAYTELTFDLTAALTSVQVDKAEDGTYKKTTAETLKTGAEVDSNTGKPTWPAAASGTNEP